MVELVGNGNGGSCDGEYSGRQVNTSCWLNTNNWMNGQMQADLDQPHCRVCSAYKL
jgi:hypothetical protein